MSAPGPWHLVAKHVSCSDLVCAACWPLYQRVLQAAMMLRGDPAAGPRHDEPVGGITITRLRPADGDVWRCTVCPARSSYATFAARTPEELHRHD